MARSQGVVLDFDREDSVVEPALCCVNLGLVQLSIDNALERARRQGLGAIAGRLESLRRDGTSPQQVDFVLGSGPVYYFPPDIEKMVRSGPKAAHPFTKRLFAWVRCRPRADGSQCCEEHTRKICLIHDHINPQKEIAS